MFEFAADMGGEDADEALLPHLQALKSLEDQITLVGFPFEKCGFILRIDGSVRAFEPSGLYNLQIERGEYLSVDLGVTQKDYNLGLNHLVDRIAELLTGVPAYLKELGDRRLQNIDFDRLDESLRALAIQYADQMRERK